MAKAKIKTKKAILKSGVKTLNKGILTTSGTVFNISKELGTKWNAFLTKALKQTEPLTEKQIDLAFDVAEKAKIQMTLGKERFESLVGLDQPIVKTLTENLSPKKVANKVTDTVAKIGAYVSKAEKEGVELTVKAKKRAKKAAKKFKATKERTEDLVEDAIDKVQEVVNATKAKVAPETSSPKTAKKTAKKSAKNGVKASAKKVNKKTKKAAKTAKKVVNTTVKADDLTIITGVGRKTVERLNEMGIYSFEAIQKLTNKELDAIIDTLGTRFKTAKAADWKKQTQATQAAK